MTITQDRYVDIVSAQIGTTAVPMRKLTARIFSTHPKISAGKVHEFTAGELEKLLGNDCAEAQFARLYFSYVSPAPASRPTELQVVAFEPIGRNPTVYGEPVDALITLSEITKGNLTITLGNVTETFTGIDLSNAESYADVASLIQTTLRTVNKPQFAACSVTFDPLESAFVLSGGVKENAEIAVDFSELSQAIGWSNGLFSCGIAPQTPLDAFMAAESLDDSFGSATFLTELNLPEAVELAQYVASQNVKYQLHLLVTPERAEEYSAALINTASTALNLFTHEGYFVQALPMAVMAATDFDRTNATTNYMYRQFNVTFPAQVNSNADADKMDRLRINYYGATAVAGSDILFYQRGFLCGGSASPVDMSAHTNEQWLKADIAQQWFTLQLSTRGIPANVDGKGRARMVIADAVNRALKNGTIMPGGTLSAMQQIAIVAVSGDDLASYDVQNRGYWYNVDIVEETGKSMQPEYVMKYTLIYRKGDSVRKIDGSHNLV